MKNFFITISIIFLTAIAIADTRSLIRELAAVTPSQIELKEDLPTSKGEGVEKRFDSDKIEQPPQFDEKPKVFTTPQNTSKEIAPNLNPIEKRN